MTTTELDLGRYQLGWSDVEDYVFKPRKGLSEEIVRDMSALKKEPEWMLKFRLSALQRFWRKPMMPWFAHKMPDLDFDDIYYYIKPTAKQVDVWDELPESVKSTYDKLGIPAAEQKYLAGVTAQYECLRGSSRVWTTAGMRRIKELVPGDEVFTLDEDSKAVVMSRVAGQRCSGDKEVFEIRALGRTIGASANHPFLTLRDERRDGRARARYALRWLPVEQLRRGDLVAVATDVPAFGTSAVLRVPADHGEPSLPAQTNIEVAWWAGIFLSDGDIHDRGRYVSLEIAVDNTDEVLLAEIIRVTRELFGVDLHLASDRLRLVGPMTARVVEWLELNGIAGTAHAKSVPDFVFSLPREERLAFLAGYLDSDGHGRENASSKDVVCTSVSDALLSQIRELVTLCGIGASSVTEVHNRHPFGKDRMLTAYQLHLSGRFDQIPARSPRRADRLAGRRFSHSHRTAKGTDLHAHTSESLGFVRIESIESVGVEPVYDIEVTGHHNFVAEGFIVHNSEVVYHRNRDDLERQGVLFSDMDSAVREHPDIVRRWFGKIIPPNDNKFAALNSAVWSGGSFIYVPPGVKVEMPLQAYFRINAENMGQFERTLIIADEGAQVHYVEGCSAPVYSTDSLHSAVVELVALPGSRITYTTIQNWSSNVYNLVTKRARAEAEAHVEWIDGNIGSRLTMKYPSVYLMGPKASGEVLSVAYAGPGQQQDTGAKMFHCAPETTSTIVSKSISKGGGIATYRGKVHVDDGADKAKSFVRCDALILDEDSISETKPYIEVEERDAEIGHEATVSKVGDDQLFYLMSRGLSEAQAMSMIVNGFIEPVTRTLPMEYAVEWSRLIELQMDGSVG
ncbi:MAG: Fe-S cluster assembly protein SufB [Acidimicrobiales bacterium]